MNDTLFAILIIYWIAGTIICGATAINYRLGAGRAMGLSIIFSPAVALIVTYLSRSWEDINREDKLMKILQERAGEAV